MTNTTGNKTMMNLQDSFLNHVRKENLPVVIYLVNGFQIRGMVRGFDNFTVIIENDGKQQLVYKHAVSTISPVANITIMQPEKAENSTANTGVGKALGILARVRDFLLELTKIVKLILGFLKK